MSPVRVSRFTNTTWRGLDRAVAVAGGFVFSNLLLFTHLHYYHASAFVT